MKGCPSQQNTERSNISSENLHTSLKQKNVYYQRNNRGLYLKQRLATHCKNEVVLHHENKEMAQ